MGVWSYGLPAHHTTSTSTSNYHFRLSSTFAPTVCNPFSLPLHVSSSVNLTVIPYLTAAIHWQIRIKTINEFIVWLAEYRTWLITDGRGRRQRREGQREAAASVPSPLPPSPAAPKKIFDGNKVPSGHFIMPRCELLNVIFYKKTQTFAFLAFSNIKKKANLQLPLQMHVQKLSVLASGGFALWPPDQGLCPWTSLHLFHANNN